MGSSHDCISAVHGNNLTLNHIRQMRTEEKRDIRHIIRRGKPPKRRPRHGVIKYLLPVWKLFQRIGIDRPCAHGIHPYPPGSKFNGQMPYQ